MALLKQSTTYTRNFLMIDSADHFTGKTGLTVTVTLSKAGGAFAAAGGTVTEISSGWYKIALTTTDTNTLGDLSFHCTATGADATDFSDQVVSFDTQDATRLGLSALPNAAAGANAGLPTVDANNAVKVQAGTGANQIDLSSGQVRLQAIDTPILHSGTAQGGAAGSITLAAGASATNDLYKGCQVKAYGGTGAGQIRTITGYTGSTKVATVDWNWITNPDATSTYAVLATEGASLNSSLQVAITQTFPTNFSSMVIDASGRVDLGRWIGIAPNALISGRVDANAQVVGDKTGYSLTQAFPTNFASASIDSSGRVLPQPSDSPTLHSGTGQAGAAGTITLAAGASATTDLYKGCRVKLYGGTGAGQSRMITAYNGSTKVATVDWSWTTIPDATTTYAVTDADGPSVNSSLQVATTASDPWATALPGSYASGTAGNIVGNRIDAAVSSRMATFTLPTNFSSLVIDINGRVDLSKWIGVAPNALISGRVDANAQIVSDKTGYSLTQAFPANFASTLIDSSGRVLPQPSDSPTLHSGTAQAGAAGAITLAAGASATTDIYKGCRVKLYGGSGAGQSRMITAYNGSTKVATVDWSWTTIPDATTTYAITDADGPSVNSSLQVTASDPWSTALPGSYAAGTAGNIVGNRIDAAVSSRMATFTLPANFSALLISAAGLVSVNDGIKKNAALNAFEFLMVDSADHVTPKTGLAVTGTKSIDGAAFAALANAVTEVANGVYAVNLAAGDLNGDVITLRFTATGADARLITIRTTP